MKRTHAIAVALLSTLVGCESENTRPPPPQDEDVYSLANGCYSIDATEPGSNDTRWLAPTLLGDGYAFMALDSASGSHFFMKPTDLGTYLLYDAEGRYVVADSDVRLERQAKLASDILLIDDSYVSGAEWTVEPSVNDGERFQLKHYKTGKYLARSGALTDDEASAAVVAFYPETGCREHPELTVDAEGTPTARTFEDGSLFGIVDAHSHMMTNFGFGGGGIFHGAPFHRLGVEHALPDCSLYHGVDGRKDILGYAYDQVINGGNFDVESFLPALLFGDIGTFNHHTAGYPDFTDWPNGPSSSTHQTQYYKWLERAYRAGLRLVVQHATGNSIFCELITGQNIQQVRYSCNDMVSVERSIAEVHNLERYIDAQEGGPGRGWLRVVTSPAEAREVISSGKLAVILGIEISNLFDCLLVPRPGMPVCDEAFLRSQLDKYYELGVRAVFPVHKYDNAFSPGDGHRAISELGNFANTGNWSDFTLDCPDVQSVFDHGNVQFGGLNQPRADYEAPPPNDMSGFPEAPVASIMPFVEELRAPALEGDYCQAHSLTPLGETLIQELMVRGMIVEIDHLPRWSYQRAFELLEAAGYPAAATHGTEYGGRIYENGGISKTGLGRCADPNRKGSMADSIRDRVARITAAGGYPAVGFGFDLNGFAGAPGPRFGPKSDCADPQTDPVTYPFDSYAGDVTFTEPRVGNRVIDFNTEGFVHIGMLPELIEDARRTGATDEDLEPLFRSAEGYLRMWERAVTQSETLK
ncbi:MAG: hypothetical protein U0271_06270 [Polyangiaceae bacterium]